MTIHYLKVLQNFHGKTGPLARPDIEDIVTKQKADQVAASLSSADGADGDLLLMPKPEKPERKQDGDKVRKYFPK